MHNAAFEALGLNWRYVACEVHPSQLSNAIQGALTMGYMGLNLTVPHKMLAVELVECIDPVAKQWGAINTIVFEGSDGQAWRPIREFDKTPFQVRAHGYNTDVDAITRAVREDLKLDIKGARILLLGAGGAGRAAALKLASDGASELYLINRTVSKADEIRCEISSRYGHVKTAVGYPPGKIDLVINATSLGLRPEDPLPLDTTLFPLGNAVRVFDMVYRPARTKLMIQAETKGCAVANGLSMLLYQGAAAFELWTGKVPPVAIMRDALEKEIYG